MRNSGDESPEKHQAYEVVLNLAQTLDEFKSQQETIQDKIDALNKNTEMLTEIIDAMGPLLVDLVQLVGDYNEILADFVDNNEIASRNQRETDMSKIEEGLSAVLRNLRNRHR